MRLSRIFAVAWENMKQRRLRASLTTLGVVIGITAIIGLASLGEGFRMEIRNRMQTGFELDNLTVIPGSLFAGLARERFFDYDVENISKIPGVKIATPVMQIGNVTLYNSRGEEVKAFVAVAVNFTEFAQVFPDRFEFESGGLPSEEENNTIIIGYKVNYPTENRTEPFAVANDNITLTLGRLRESPPPLPPRYETLNYTFTVAGTLQRRGTPGITNFDYWIFIPLKAAREIYATEQSDLIFVKVNDPEDSERIADQIESLFPPYKVTILVPLTFIRQVDNVLNLVQLFLMAIASISLLVAGIGIMNIMTVSVMERTREIGILKAIGAKNRTVLAMFLSEAILIGVIGSLIGVFAGYGFSYALSYMLSSFMNPQRQGGVLQAPETQRLRINPAFSLEWTIIAFVFGLIVCIIFGLYPARKAAKLNPVDALRYE
ncbi:MAG: FtsX-like permease family protein [Nitrososphaerota archaeon]|nr:ABC transporter permease [Candidatus Bathyarchaeota archaeon]MDW8022428.1 FtsX-like permease family protein [Nitrososphaerota archaeon]